MIRKELLEKGVSLSIVNKALINVDDNRNAHQLAERMYRNIGTKDIKEVKQKLYGRLIRKGFSTGVALSSIDNMWNSRIESDEISL
jgi:SOS response regulatory protein OraA/RecX